jgi:hypothetical protein
MTVETRMAEDARAARLTYLAQMDREELMAEDPKSWSPFERSLNEAIRKHRENQAKGLVGPSLTKFVADYLSREGWVWEQKNRPR